MTMNITRIDEYYCSSADRPSIRSYRHCRSYRDLLLLHRHAILFRYLSIGKGGYSDCDVRILHSRGGSTEAERIEGHGMEGNQEKEIDCQQVRRRVTDTCQRPASLCGQDADSAIRTGKVTIVLSVAEPAPNVSQALSASSCSRYLIVILPYGKAKDKG